MRSLYKLPTETGKPRKPEIENGHGKVIEHGKLAKSHGIFPISSLNFGQMYAFLRHYEIKHQLRKCAFSDLFCKMSRMAKFEQRDWSW